MLNKFTTAVFLLSILTSLPGATYAQKSEQQFPAMTMTIYLVPETIACRPNGYAEPCKLWTAEEIDRIRNGTSKIGRIITQEVNIPPGEIILKDNLFRSIDLYSQIPVWKRPIEDRKSVLIVFQWEEPQGTTKEPIPVSLIRYAKKQEQPPYGVPPYGKCIVNTGKLRERWLWIDHERAESFHPLYGVEWTLKVGTHEWTYRTQKEGISKGIGTELSSSKTKCSDPKYNSPK